MDKNTKEVCKNVGEAALDSLLALANIMTFGSATNFFDLVDKFGNYYNNTQRLHAIKQLSHFYNTPSRLFKVTLDDFKEKHEDYENIVLDLIKTLDLTVDNKQAIMLAKLFECYVLAEIDQDIYLKWKYIITKLDAYLLKELDKLAHIHKKALSGGDVANDFINFGFIEQIVSPNVFANGKAIASPNYEITQEFKDFYDKIFNV